MIREGVKGKDVIVWIEIVNIENVRRRTTTNWNKRKVNKLQPQKQEQEKWKCMWENSVFENNKQIKGKVTHNWKENREKK